MKKIYLFLTSAVMLGTASVGFAQHANSNGNNSADFGLQGAPADQVTNRTKVTTVKKDGKIITNNKAAVDGRADYGSALFNLLGSSTLELGFTNPIMPDSSTFVDFTSSTASTTQHAIGMVYDPTDGLFGTEQFTSLDAVNVDTIFVDGLYFLNDATDNNDSLVIRVMIADPGAAGNPFSFYTMVPSFTLLNDTGRMTSFDYVGSASHGVHSGLQGPVTAMYGHQFTVADTVGGAQEFAFYTPGLTIPAGFIMGVYAEFVPTAGGWTQGDTTDLVNNSGDYNAFRPLVYRNVTPGTMYNFTSIQYPNNSLQHNSIALFNRTRYDATAVTTNDLPGAFFTVTTVSNSIYAHVSGTSSVGIDELANDVKFSVYPNPSNGEFNINLNANNANTVALTVRNVVGQTVISKTIAVNGQTKETISLTDYSKGIYFLTVDNNTVKIIVE